MKYRNAFRVRGLKFGNESWHFGTNEFVMYSPKVMPTTLTLEASSFSATTSQRGAYGRGYEVIAAANANEAISIPESTDDIRIMITDVNMPGSMDGSAAA